MVKGINRQTIEIIDTGNEYYERALLIVKPEYSDVQNEILEREAHKLLKQFGAPSSMEKPKKTLYWILRFGVAAVLGAGLTFAALSI